MANLINNTSELKDILDLLDEKAIGGGGSYDDGYTNGYDAGLEEGTQQGYSEGYGVGLEEGRTQGYEEGKSEPRMKVSWFFNDSMGTAIQNALGSLSSKAYPIDFICNGVTYNKIIFSKPYNPALGGYYYTMTYGGQTQNFVAYNTTSSGWQGSVSSGTPISRIIYIFGLTDSTAKTFIRNNG